MNILKREACDILKIINNLNHSNYRLKWRPQIVLQFLFFFFFFKKGFFQHKQPLLKSCLTGNGTESE